MAQWKWLSQENDSLFSLYFLDAQFFLKTFAFTTSS